MKKVFVLLISVLLFSTLSYSQTRFGIKGGLNFTNISNLSSDVEKTWKNQTGYQLGVALQIKIPVIGLAIQPELLYSTVKSASDNGNEINLDYLTLPVNIQLGTDMLFFRPFIVASPFVSYMIDNNVRLEDQPVDEINRFDYGVGVGVGIDIWKLQIMGKYNWGLGKIENAGDEWDQSETYKDATLQGFQLSIAFLF
ncbi:MAG TPA: porin family protein [Bacteroidales bacterium]|jgi:hypothetical protein|nr:porin family protein [Bacteroidales bacterium]HRR48666.1 porin family protein [Bacteroidales bacterium]HRT33593.1 porin family protein [Bacteroidales bacterium]HRT84683.1 porin family protein [Bacteroidales bacterium]